MTRVLEKEWEKTEKIQAIKAEREKEIERNRENSIRNMIKKERVQEAIFLIAKSPKSKAAQDQIRQFNLIKKPVTPAEDIE